MHGTMAMDPVPASAVESGAVMVKLAHDAAPRMDHLSWASLQMYATCPARFALRYIHKAPEERKCAALVFGSAIHSAVEQIHQARLKGRELPCVEKLFTAFQSAWVEGEREGPPVAYRKSETKESLRDMARGMLAAYREYAQTLKGQILGIKLGVRYRLMRNAPPLDMQIDLLESEEDALILTGLEISGAPWSEQEVRANLPQLVVYCTAIIPTLMAMDAERIVPRFVVLTQEKPSKVQVIEPKVDQSDVSHFLERIGETWDGIHAQVFPKREGLQCDSCSYRDRCKRRGR
jgi:hypothetical protein